MRHNVAPLAFMGKEQRGIAMNECTIIFGDGQEALLYGEDFGLDFETMESTALVNFVRSHLSAIRKSLEEGEANERNRAADGRAGAGGSS